MRIHVAIPLLGACALATAAAQEPAAEAKAPLFRLASVDGRPLRALALLLGGNPGAFEVPAGKHGELRVADDFAPRLSTVDGEVAGGAWLEAQALPSAWLSRLGDAVDEFEHAFGARFAAIAAQTGIERDHAKALLHDLIGVARDAERIDVTVRRGSGRDTGIVLQLAPRPGTGLHRWTQLLVPGKREVPTVARDGDFVQIGIDVAADRIAGLCDPFVPWVAALTSGSGDEAVAEFRRSLASQDGRGSIAAGRAGIRMALGLQNGKTYAEVAFSPGNLERTKAALARQRIDAEYTPGALEYRGVRAMKSVVDGGRPMPLFGSERGEVTGYLAVAGDLALSVAGAGADEAVIKTLVDGALDGKLPRRALAAADGSARSPPLLTVTMDLAGLLAAVPESVRPKLGDDQPRNVRISLHQTGTALELRIQLQ
jgi:hypothetical protein